MKLAAPVSTETPPAVRATGWREAAIALSFANLSFVRLWSELLTYSRADTYTMKLPYPPASYLAVIVDVLLIGAAGWCAAFLIQRSENRAVDAAGRVAFLAALALPLNALRAMLANTWELLRSPLFDRIGTRGVLFLGLGLAAAALFLVLRWPERLTRIAATVLLVLFPLVPVTFAQALWRAATYDASGFRDGAAAPPLPAKAGPRVVWVILDEWDQRLTFVDRPAGIQLPEIDRLRRESLYAANAEPPGSATLFSMPALITGRPVTTADKYGPSELLLTQPGEPPRTVWRSQPNVFAAARTAGFNTALIGSFHPYCRVLASSLTHCEWWEASMQYNSMGHSFRELVPNQARSLLETSLWSVFGQSLSTREHVRLYLEMMPRALQAAANSAYGLTLLHLQTPHAPHGYNRRTGRFDLKNSAVKGYADSLVLADRTVGEIRQALERAGLWDTSTVLFSSDHSYRAAQAFDGKSDPRIPFLLKMAGPPAGLEFAPRIDTVRTGELLMAILRGEVRTTTETAAWMERRMLVSKPGSPAGPAHFND